MVSAVEMIQPGGGTTQVQYRYDKGTINLLSSLILTWCLDRSHNNKLDTIVQLSKTTVFSGYVDWRL